MEELVEQAQPEEEVAEIEEPTASEEEEVSGEDTPAEPEEVEQRPSGIQKRINELTRARYEEKRRADELERRLHEVYTKPVETTTSESPPKEDDFDTYEAYMAEFARYEARQEFQRLQKTTEAQKQEAKKKETESQFASRVEKLKADGNMKYDDFIDVTTAMPLTRDTLSAVMESDIGHDILYHLANHPDEAQEIAGMSVHGQALAVGRLEMKLKQPTKKTTKAPAPIDPVSTTGMTGKVDLYNPNIDDDTFSKEFRKRRQKLRGY
jgi:hypothetical protein